MVSIAQPSQDDEIPGLFASNSSGSSAHGSAPSTPTRLNDMVPLAKPKGHHHPSSKSPELPDDDFEFAVATLDLINADRKTLLSCLWSLVLGVSALFDVLATLLPMWFVDDVQAGKAPLGSDIFEWRQRADGMLETNDPWLIDLIIWMRRHAVMLGFLFSFLCFIDIFVKANKRRQQALIDRDREALLNATTRSISTVEERQWWKGAWGVFYRTVGFQMLLLPVSFYFLIYHWLHLWMKRDKSKVDHGCEDITVVIRGLQKISGKYETFSTDVYTGLGVAILRHAMLVFLSMEAGPIRSAVFHFGMRVFRFAVRHPKLFGSRLRKTLRSLRWANYLAPVIGTFNKVLGNSLDLLKRYNQRRQWLQAEKGRERAWRKLTPTERRALAVVRIQCMYRSYQTRKAFAALRLLRGDREAFAALKIQRVLRGMLARARLRLLEKGRELQQLLEREENSSNADDMKHMSAEDRKRVYQLEDELEMVADKLINRELLLRPNTTFSVLWRLVFVACALFEISVLIFQPQLAKFKDEKTGKPLDICRIMQDTLVPTPITAWETCAVPIEKPKKVLAIFHAVQKVVPKKKKIPVEAIEPHKPPRWYCHHVVARTHSWFRSVLKWLISEFMLFLAFVSFIDVPISFFIGELDPKTGVLVPKDWFTRWILPGIVLQLIVNPEMGRITSLVVRLIHGALLVGVERAYRWFVMLVRPVIAICVHVVVVYIWHPMVKWQNGNLMSRQRKTWSELISDGQFNYAPVE